MSAMSATQIHATVDFDRPGNQQGHLCVPYSYNLGGWANLLVPITVVNTAPGPTALVMAGNHGDEYPGQVAILRLMRELACRTRAGARPRDPDSRAQHAGGQGGHAAFALGRQEPESLVSRPAPTARPPK